MAYMPHINDVGIGDPHHVDDAEDQLSPSASSASTAAEQDAVDDGSEIDVHLCYGPYSSADEVVALELGDVLALDAADLSR